MINLIGTYETILQSIRRIKLKWNVIKYMSISDKNPPNMVEGNRKCGGPKRKWIDDIEEWSKMTQYDLMVATRPQQMVTALYNASSLIYLTIRESME